MAKLPSRKGWERHVKRLKSITPAAKSKKLIKGQLKQQLTDAVAKRIPKKRFGIMFSGGVDSSFIALACKKLKANFICYSVGIENSKDVAEAKKAAARLKLKLRCKTFSEREAEAIVKKAALVVGKPDAVNIGIACVAIAVAQLARKDKVNTFLTGLGSEEIFAGYQRHETAKDVNRECWRGLKAMRERDFVRDSKVAAAMKINFLVPFLDDGVIVAAMSVPGRCKIKGNEKKAILREIASEMGLPKQFAYRKKLAAQYGSGFDKAIERLARKKGFRYKKDYLASILA